MAKGKKDNKEEKGPSYEEAVATLRANLDTYQEFYYAQIRRQEGGAKANRDAWIGAKLGFKQVGLEGVLESLDSQVESAIESGDGLAGTLTASKAVENNAAIFEGCALSLKVKDLAPYIQLGLGNVKLDVKDEYKETTLHELMDKKAGREKNAYGTYLMGQLQNTVMGRVSSAVYIEHARRLNDAYAAEGARTYKLKNGIPIALRAKNAAEEGRTVYIGKPEAKAA